MKAEQGASNFAPHEMVRHFEAYFLSLCGQYRRKMMRPRYDISRDSFTSAPISVGRPLHFQDELKPRCRYASWALRRRRARRATCVYFSSKMAEAIYTLSGRQPSTKEIRGALTRAERAAAPRARRLLLPRQHCSRVGSSATAMPAPSMITAACKAPAR